jgi:hypothetical protein
MRPVETIPGMGGGIKKNLMDGVNSSMIYLIFVSTFINATIYPQHNKKFF